MSNIYITDIYHHLFPKRESKVPRERYIRYVTDLYQLYKEDLSEETFVEGSQYNYAEMGEVLLDEVIKIHSPEKIDMMLVSYWVHEFDPDYVSCGPYFSEKYQISGDIFDVCDQGTIAPFTALRIIEKYHSYGEKNKSILLLFEQTSVPRDKKSFHIIPTLDTAMAMVIENDPSTAKFKVLSCQKISEYLVLQDSLKVIKFLLNMLQNHSIKQTELDVCVKKGTYIFRVLQHYYLSNSCERFDAKIISFDNRPGCIPAWEYLYQQKVNSSEKPYLLILDEDVESLSIECLLLERV